MASRCSSGGSPPVAVKHLMSMSEEETEAHAALQGPGCPGLFPSSCEGQPPALRSEGRGGPLQGAEEWAVLKDSV